MEAIRAALSVVVAATLVTLLCASCSSSDSAQTSDAPPLPTNEPIRTTIQAIAASKFKSAIDKQGHGGVLVRVGNLRVLKIVPNEDGDLHVVVTDGKMPTFITEIIPRDQNAGVTRPYIGSVIEETGTAYFDVESNVPDHEYTPWEIHPVTSWRLDPGHPGQVFPPTSPSSPSPTVANPSDGD
ncbi:MAG: hypothetical protein JWM72_4304 [Actinomycetia bacterium]|jgi:hypothetical protein|nr:hypothetical protein [Actinomycetes bacterium]